MLKAKLIVLFLLCISISLFAQTPKQGYFNFGVKKMVLADSAILEIMPNFKEMVTQSMPDVVVYQEDMIVILKLDVQGMDTREVHDLKNGKKYEFIEKGEKRFFSVTTTEELQQTFDAKNMSEGQLDTLKNMFSIGSEEKGILGFKCIESTINTPGSDGMKIKSFIAEDLPTAIAPKLMTLYLPKGFGLETILDSPEMALEYGALDFSEDISKYKTVFSTDTKGMTELTAENMGELMD